MRRNIQIALMTKEYEQAQQDIFELKAEMEIDISKNQIQILSYSRQKSLYVCQWVSATNRKFSLYSREKHDKLKNVYIYKCMEAIV